MRFTDHFLDQMPGTRVRHDRVPGGVRVLVMKPAWDTILFTTTVARGSNGAVRVKHGLVESDDIIIALRKTRSRWLQRARIKYLIRIYHSIDHPIGRSRFARRTRVHSVDYGDLVLCLGKNGASIVPAVIQSDRHRREVYAQHDFLRGVTAYRARNESCS